MSAPLNAARWSPMDLVLVGDLGELIGRMSAHESWEMWSHLDASASMRRAQWGLFGNERLIVLSVQQSPIVAAIDRALAYLDGINMEYPRRSVMQRELLDVLKPGVEVVAIALYLRYMIAAGIKRLEDVDAADDVKEAMVMIANCEAALGVREATPKELMLQFAKYEARIQRVNLEKYFIYTARIPRVLTTHRGCRPLDRAIAYLDAAKPYEYSEEHSLDRQMQVNGDIVRRRRAEEAMWLRTIKMRRAEEAVWLRQIRERQIEERSWMLPKRDSVLDVD